MDEDALFLRHQYSVDPTASVNTAASYSAGYIVLSFFTSLIGCITTLELLQRRTSTRGAYNWFLLLASAITMGGIGIWAMHFVGNRAIILEQGNPQRQILYSPGFTAVSFFMPIAVLLFAFYLLGMPTRARQFHVAIAGVFTGAAVCGMHYLGQLGIENYDCSYRIQNVVAAAIIAVLASFIALSAFFRLRDTWTDSWWKRALCGAIMALAVSGMHWTAAVGTIYSWKGNLAVHGSSRKQTALIASCLSMGSCVVLLIVASIRGRNKRSARIKAQRLVLACAYFDEDGKLMVTQEGILPSEKITNRYVEKTFGEDELNRSQSTFLWIFKASHNWGVLKDLIPAMKEFVETDPAVRRYRPGYTGPTSPDDSSDLSLNFAPIFKQLYCVAAQQLANLIHEPLERIGVLFEEPLETGAIYVSTHTEMGFRGLSANPYRTMDPENRNTPPVIARGKYLFLTRQINRNEAAKFAALGYRFAAVGQIADPLAKSMQVHRDNMVARLERMRLSTQPDRLPPPGVHLACFMLRPSMSKSFDVLVQAATQSQLPYVTLQPGDLSPTQSQQLRCFDDATIGETLRVLVNRPSGFDLDEEIRWQLYNAFVQLVDIIGDADTMMQAKFSAREFRLPCRTRGQPTSSTCTLLTVRVLRNIHASSTRKELTYVPLSFFGAQQHIQTTDSNDESFARKVRAEFGHLGSGDPTKYKGASSVRVDRMSSSAESSVLGAESPRSAIFKNPMGRFLPSRRSDEATIVDREKSIAEGSDFEATGMTSPDPPSPFDKHTHATQPDVTELVAVGSEKGSWVTELFGLFRQGADGWGSTTNEGWKWDINVQKSFEVGTENRQQEE
ncbi:uncharacterized protein Z518_03076 [Rhinocladiella mackenziei CBS 650.93]|uniref:MHYT domain-containing protein n=1 Tax=Rhinocladiella mackenziei CBS 650.93 TaxID=1442369 RepID=A0A0D2JGF7_9EURO|nr:uncharacterized protein Z518_03076 [Rhinocladiella mackenziei CBS 650.93]KIX08420.1 hypothetical protein Z518_03076 [Rhinocladiella mackenziei CBS 650.93]